MNVRYGYAPYERIIPLTEEDEEDRVSPALTYLLPNGQVNTRVANAMAKQNYLGIDGNAKIDMSEVDFSDPDAASEIMMAQDQINRIKGTPTSSLSVGDAPILPTLAYPQASNAAFMPQTFAPNGVDPSDEMVLGKQPHTPGYDAMIASGMGRISQLEEDNKEQFAIRGELADKIAAPAQMGKADAIGNILTTLASMGAGYALGGGGKMGLGFALLGGGKTIQGNVEQMNEDKKRQDLANVELIKGIDQEIAMNRAGINRQEGFIDNAQLAQINKDEARQIALDRGDFPFTPQFNEKERAEQSKYNQEVTPSLKTFADRIAQAQTPEEVGAIPNPGATDREMQTAENIRNQKLSSFRTSYGADRLDLQKQKQAIYEADVARKREALDFTQKWKSKGDIPPKDVEPVEAALNGNLYLKQLKQVIGNYINEKGLGTNSPISWAQLEAESVNPASETSQMMRRLNYEGIKAAVTMLGRQNLSNKDVDNVGGFISNKASVSTGQILQSLDIVLDGANINAVTRLNTLRDNPNTKDSSIGFGKRYYDSLDNSEKESWGRRLDPAFKISETTGADESVSRYGGDTASSTRLDEINKRLEELKAKKAAATGGI